MSDVRIAKTEIFHDGARAHMPGDEVPAENVKLRGWEDLVVGPDTKIAAQLQGSPPPRRRAKAKQSPAAPPTVPTPPPVTDQSPS